MFRLSDLDGQFTGGYKVNPNRYRRQPGLLRAQGVLFQCPKCAIGLEAGTEEGRRFVRGAHYVACWFSNPNGAAVAPPEALPAPRWTVEAGSTSIDDLTLSPSIAIVGGCAWHGFVRNGALVDA